ncbi:MAG: hypothetical protein QM680_04345 [Luteolibacter sp.]
MDSADSSAKSSRRMWWCLGLLAVCASLIAAGYAYSNWQGQKDLDAFHAQFKSLGYETDLKKIYSRQIPDEDNFFKHPAVQAELTAPKKLSQVIDDKLKTIAPKSRNNTAPLYHFTESTDITKWGYGEAGASPKEIAEGLLGELTPEIKKWEEIREAFSRPDHQMSYSWEPYQGVETPVSRENSILFSLWREEARLASLYAFAGNREEFLKCIQSQFSSFQLTQSEPPNFLSFLIQASIIRAISWNLKDALPLNDRSDDEYLALEEILSRFDRRSDFEKAYYGEMAWSFRLNRVALFAQPHDPTENWEWNKEAIWDNSKSTVRSLRPNGIAATKHVRAREVSLEHFARGTNHFTRPISGEDYQYFETLCEQTSDVKFTHWRPIYTILGKYLEDQSMINLLRTEIALRRYHLKHGNYPTSLDALTPELLPSVLEDPYDRKPLRYRWNNARSVTLWAIGTDGVDDSGTPPQKTNDSIGDFVREIHGAPVSPPAR